MVDDPQGNHILYEGSHRGVPEEGDEIGGGPVWDDGTGWVLGTPVKCRYEWYAEMSATPTSASLFVWLPETRAKWAEHQHAIGGDAVEFGDERATPSVEHVGRVQQRRRQLARVCSGKFFVGVVQRHGPGDFTVCGLPAVHGHPDILVGVVPVSTAGRGRSRRLCR